MRRVVNEFLVLDTRKVRSSSHCALDIATRSPHDHLVPTCCELLEAEGWSGAGPDPEIIRRCYRRRDPDRTSGEGAPKTGAAEVNLSLAPLLCCVHQKSFVAPSRTLPRPRATNALKCLLCVAQFAIVETTSFRSWQYLKRHSGTYCTCVTGSVSLASGYRLESSDLMFFI